MTAIFSIKPKYSALIFSGEKTVELRKTYPRRMTEDSRIFFWETSPSKLLVGTAIVSTIVKIPKAILWKKTSRMSGISKKEFDEYFRGTDEGIALYLKNVVEFNKKLDLKLLRHALGFRPPQSFRYISQKESDFFSLQIS